MTKLFLDTNIVVDLLSIITRNGKDFSNSKLPVMTAGEFLATLDH